jgi:hypothetical protein
MARHTTKEMELAAMANTKSLYVRLGPGGGRDVRAAAHRGRDLGVPRGCTQRWRERALVPKPSWMECEAVAGELQEGNILNRQEQDLSHSLSKTDILFSPSWIGVILEIYLQQQGRTLLTWWPSAHVRGFIDFPSVTSPEPKRPYRNGSIARTAIIRFLPV